MAEEITEVRPAVISGSVRFGLEEYRGFRHIVRNVYTYNFDSDKRNPPVPQHKITYS